jgi:signal transduction histidine kinase
LLSNAFKFSGPDTVVTMEAEAGSMDDVRGILVRVRDGGIGRPPEVVERVFERFYRVGGDRARQTGGTGLGLSIVKNVVQAHGGRVTLESKPGEGSTFSIFLRVSR